MQVTVEIPDELAAQKSAHDMSRELLEAYAAEAYRLERMSRAQVGRLLGLDRWQTEELLTRRGAKREFTVADYELEGPPPQ